MANSKATAPTEVAVPTVVRSFKRGEAKYAPRVDHTVAAWDKVQAALIKGKGTATYKQLCDTLEVHFNRPDENHHDFIGYMVRRGALAEVVSK